MERLLVYHNPSCSKSRGALEILADPAEARQMARRGKEQVRLRFLTPRLMRNWLALMHHFEGEQVELDFHDARA